MACSHCPSHPITKDELDWYRENGYFEGMKIGDPLVAPSSCICWKSSVQKCNCKDAYLNHKFANQEPVTIHHKHLNELLSMGFPLSMFRILKTMGEPFQDDFFCDLCRPELQFENLPLPSWCKVHLS